MKTFCPNCEKETESTFICEVHCCNECDEDNGNYEKPLTTKLQDENNKWKHLGDMKNDALDSYAEFYNQCLSVCNMDVDTNPCTEVDERILETLRKGANNERLS